MVARAPDAVSARTQLAPGPNGAVLALYFRDANGHTIELAQPPRR